MPDATVISFVAGVAGVTGVGDAAGDALAALATIAGCETAPKPTIEPDPDVQIPPGEHGLRKLSREEYPDLSAAFAARDANLERALERSAQWFGTGTSRQNYSSEQMGPLVQVVGDHARAAASVYAFREL
ncbi:MAG: hypothetical protein ACO327_03760, partial [Gemmatimonadaceae bacterium]